MSKSQVSAGPWSFQTMLLCVSLVSGGLLVIFGGPWLAAVSFQALPLSSRGTLSLCISLLFL